MSRTLPHYPSRTDTEPRPVERQEPVLWGDPDVGPLAGSPAQTYERDGFLVIPELLAPDEVRSLDEELLSTADRLAPEHDERVVRERGSNSVRSIFEIHLLSDAVARLIRDPRLLDRVEQIVGSPAYIHQSRVNFKPGLRGREFYWHSDFETWHLEDGMPQMRAVSVSINLTENLAYNGSLMIMPGSHRTFVGCRGATPDNHYRESLRAQHYGTPSDAALHDLAAKHGIVQVTAPVGSAVFFDSNCMHGSNGNITPFPRRNLFVVFNSIDNPLTDPFGGTQPRPDFIATRNVQEVRESR